MFGIPPPLMGSRYHGVSFLQFKLSWMMLILMVTLLKSVYCSMVYVSLKNLFRSGWLI